MSASLEFERFIGSNPISNGAVYHPDGTRYVFSAGGNVVIGDLIDPSAQSFLQRWVVFLCFSFYSLAYTLLLIGMMIGLRQLQYHIMVDLLQVGNVEGIAMYIYGVLRQKKLYILLKSMIIIF